MENLHQGFLTGDDQISDNPPIDFNSIQQNTTLSQDNYQQVQNLLIEKFHLSGETAKKVVDSAKDQIDHAPEEAAKAAGNYLLGLITGGIMSSLSALYYKCTGKEKPEEIARKQREDEIKNAVKPRFDDLESNISRIAEMPTVIMKNQGKSQAQGKFTQSLTR